MKKIDINTWSRRQHFEFFNGFDEPFFGLTTRVDLTSAYALCKKENKSLYQYYLHGTLWAINRIPELRTRIVEGKVYIFDVINVSPTVLRSDESFGFSFVEYHENFEHFSRNARVAFEKTLSESGLNPGVSGQDVIHFSAIPWVDFSSISHARNYKFPDSCPKVSFGKIVHHEDKCDVAVSFHAHHGLADGLHAGKFFEYLQSYLNQ